MPKGRPIVCDRQRQNVVAQASLYLQGTVRD